MNNGWDKESFRVSWVLISERLQSGSFNEFWVNTNYSETEQDTPMAQLQKFWITEDRIKLPYSAKVNSVSAQYPMEN